MAQINLRVDDNIKKQADNLFAELGMTTQTAMNVFLKEALRQKGFPFKIHLDPFYSEFNMRELKKSFKQANEGKLTAHELIKE